MCNEFRQYLGFQWNNCYFVWNVLPFGLCCSPYYFSKILRPVIIHLREQGLRVNVYVDDFLLLSQQNCITDHTDQLLHVLTDLGCRHCWWYVQHLASMAS